MRYRRHLTGLRARTYTQLALSSCGVALLLLLLPRVAPAQSDAAAYGAVAGTVRDEAGQPVVAAEVAIGESGRHTYTDEEGYFLLSRVPLGNVTIHVRRLGFKPRDVTTFVSRANAAREVAVVLVPLPQRIAAVQVKEKRTHTGPMADFYHRLESKAGGGHFFTREQIDSIRPHRTSDLLSRVPGLTFRQVGGTMGGEGMSIRSRDTRCSPLIWVDGTPAAVTYYDPDLVNPRVIEGIEIYSGVATVPPALAGPAGTGSCGVIAIWTRAGDHSDRGADKEERAQAVAKLEAIVDSVQVFTEDQVDSPAQLAPSSPFHPEYPSELRQRNASGVVVAEFVVDATGHVERPTFGVVYSPDSLFTAAVSKALESAVFKPAVRRGRSVRQLVQLPVHFVDPQGAAK